MVVNNDVKKTGKNYLFNLLNQICLIIVPLITTPYISRVLLPDGIGKYSFSMSIITYFTIFSAMGFAIYGQRGVLFCKDKYEKSRFFWEICICKLITVAVSLVIHFLLLVLRVYNEYSLYLLILSINILSVLFDISFFYQGIEKFGIIAFFNVLFKIVGTISIFIFVRSEDDLWIYTLINSIAIIAPNISLWFLLPKYISFVRFKNLNFFHHFKKTILFFIPAIAVGIYTILDRTLIGVLIPEKIAIIENGIEITKKISDIENGYYEQSEKLVKMALSIITCLSSIMISRNSYHVAREEYKEVKDNIYLSSKIVWTIGLPIMFGLIAISSSFVPIFYGEGYEKCVILICIFSLLVPLIGFSHVFGMQYLIPMRFEKKYTLVTVIGAITNLILNVIFIPLFYSIGAAIASVTAEFIIMIILACLVKKEISISKILSFVVKPLISSVIMFAGVLLIGLLFEGNTVYELLIRIISGVVIYFLCMLIARDDIIILVISNVKNKFKKIK